jgi:predicted RNA-binding Zn-ribbon protein involved in translation (DUF1610 family)
VSGELRCERTELLVEQCAHCRPPVDDQVPDEDIEVVWRGIARYDGQCPGCGGRIREGDPIARTGDNRYVCEECSL